MSERHRALLVGAFGQRNPGDEALLEAFVDGLPDHDLLVTSSNPEHTRRRYGCEAVSVGSSAAVLGALRASDAVVFAGGTLFKLLHPSTGRAPLDLLRKALAVAVIARATGKPVAMLGVGAGELSTPPARRFARLLARQADLLVVRDEESARALVSAGLPAPVRVGADAAWGLVAAPPVDGVRPATALVTLSSLAGGARPEETVVPLVVAVTERLHAHGLAVQLQPWQVGGSGLDDADLAALAGAAFRARGSTLPVILPPPTDLADARRSAAGARVVVGLRFHSLVAAAAAGTPFLAVAHEHKLTALARRLAQPTLRPDADGATVAATVDALLDSPAPPPSAVRAEIAAAEEGFALLRLLLDGGTALSAEAVHGLQMEPATW